MHISRKPIILQYRYEVFWSSCLQYQPQNTPRPRLWVLPISRKWQFPENACKSSNVHCTNLVTIASPPVRGQWPRQLKLSAFLKAGVQVSTSRVCKHMARAVLHRPLDRTMCQDRCALGVVPCARQKRQLRDGHKHSDLMSFVSVSIHVCLWRCRCAFICLSRCARHACATEHIYAHVYNVI